MRFPVALGARIVALAVVLAVSASCSDPYAPLTPSPATKTDSFSGSFSQGGSVAHPFAVSAYGPVTVTVTSVAPLATMGLGVALALWDGANCGVATTLNVNAKAGAQALNVNVYAGSYCIRMYDSGNLPADWTVTYSVDVLHP